MGVFLQTLLRLSILGCVPAVLLMALKPLRKRVGQTVFYYLWLPVLLRLCIPVGVTIPVPVEQAAPAAPAFSAVLPAPSSPAAPVFPDDAVPAENEPADSAGIHAPSLPATPDAPAAPAAPERPLAAALALDDVLFAVWAVGVLACLGRYVWGYVRFSRTIRRSALPAPPERQAALRALDPAGRVRLLESPLAGTPMVLGAVRAAIILPVGVDADRLEDVLAHELTHIRRYDLLYKWFAAAVTSLHWFNPLMILIRREVGCACELACDEAVLRGVDEAGRRRYGETLLAVAAVSDHLPTLALCEEKARLKERLVSIARCKKRGRAALALSVLLAVVVAGCAAVNGLEAAPLPSGEDPSPTSSGTEPTPAPSGVPGTGEPNAALLSAEDVVLYEAQGMTVAFPKDIYDELLILPGEDENTLVQVYEKKSYEASQGDMGFLFAISREDQAAYEWYLMGDGSGRDFFAQVGEHYYCWHTASDLQRWSILGDFEADQREWERVFQRTLEIRADFIIRNGLTAFDGREIFRRQFLYDGEHRYAAYSNWSQSMTLVLSQPVKQGEGGIWCVERWYVMDTGSCYFSFYMEGFPQREGVSSAEHYRQLQDAADAGARADLLDPRRAALAWLQNYYRNTAVITVALDDVTLLEEEPAGYIFPRISAVLEQKQDMELSAVEYENGIMIGGNSIEMPDGWAEQNISLARRVYDGLGRVLWCRAEPELREINGPAVYCRYMRPYMSAPDRSVVFLENGLVGITEGMNTEWFRPLDPAVNPYETMYGIFDIAAKIV